MIYSDLSEEQTNAFIGILNSVINRANGAMLPEQRSVLLKAPAGTGKTYVARHVAKFLDRAGMSVSCVAFSGRAASQLSKSGLPARTCHSLLYKPVLNEDGDLIRWEVKTKQEVLAEAGDVLICDEGSMIPLKMHKELIALGIPLIYLGDYDQLPPVDEDDANFNVMENFNVPTFSLVENRRFDETSGIGHICSRLRQENTLPRIVMHGLKCTPKTKVFNVQYHRENDFDVIVCGTNKTRKRLNEIVRSARGFSSETPDVGEYVVCLKNDIIAEKRINNGEVFVVENVITGDTYGTYYLTSIDNAGKHVIVRVQNHTWVDEKVEFKRDEKFCSFGFAYALSCHKVQGSSFKRVLFIDEDVSFFLDQRRYRYTGVSRAMEHLTIAY